MTKSLLLVIVIVNIISAAFAGIGLARLTADLPISITIGQQLAAVTTILDPGTWHLAFCITIGAVIQALGNVSWVYVFQRRGLIIPSLVGAVVSLVSAWLSAVIILLNAEAAALAHENRLDAINPARESLTLFVTSLTAASAGLADAAATADELARLEEEQGGTCPAETGEGATMGGDGPRMRMRDRHSQLLDGVAASMAALADRFIEFDFRLQQASPADLPEVYAQAVALSRSPELERLRTALQPIRTDLAEGWVDGGNFITCPTPDFLAKVDLALTNLDVITPMSTTLPVERQPGTGDATNLLLASLQAWLTGEPQPNANALWSLLRALGIELLQVILIAWRENIRRRLGQGHDGYDIFWGAGRHRAHLATVIAALDRHTWFDGEEEFYAAPTQSVPNGRLPVAFFGLKLVHRNLRHFDIESVDPAWVAARSLQGSTFNLYRLPEKQIARWRRIAERDLGAPQPRHFWQRGRQTY
jgi:hypothetical protein